MATLSDIQAKIQKLQAQAEEIARKQSSAVLAEIRSLMGEHGVTIADLDTYLGESGRGRKAASAKFGANHAGAAKYRDPKTGATWSGRGRAPAWIASAKDRSKFLIDADKVVTKSPTTKQPKAGNYVRGPQEPKYRDPQSGATWSGRGKAPGWLASAVDRTAFLIKASGTASSEPAKPVAKKATTKKAAAKKSVAKKAVVKTAPAQKTAAKKATAEKAATKKTTAKKAAAKKGAAKAAAANKTPARAAASGTSEASATTTPVKKAAAKKAPAKKASAKKVAAKKVSQAPESLPPTFAPQLEAGESGTSESA